MSRLLALAPLLIFTTPIQAAEPAPGKDYLEFVRKQAASLRANDQPPATREEWNPDDLRSRLTAIWGFDSWGAPSPFKEDCPLDPQSHGELQRDGYRVEKITFQTRPGIRMTANLYLPDKKGKLPAILQVHGHWRGAKQDPVVQSRCIGAAKLGYVVLCVDAFGAGERAIGTALGEYHGDMTGATLLPVGLPLSGIQVFENMRAVDYLLTRPEVDKDRIGITGASGGGNQTMYAGAYDTRFKCVVPVCSVGNYQAYLGAACCMCEVVPGALKHFEEGSLLGMVAPRALMVVSATKDANQFSVGEAKKSLAFAEPIFKLHGKPANVRHAIFESPHDYSKAMREEMYGWMAQHLKGEGDGSPIKEPAFKTENPEDLRCFPGNTRPKDWITLPQFAAAEGKKLLAARKLPGTAREWSNRRMKLSRGLIEDVLGGFPVSCDLDVTSQPTVGDKTIHDGKIIQFQSEPGIRLATVVEPARIASPLVIMLNCDGGVKASTSAVAGKARAAGWTVAGLELRATGTRALPNETIGRAPDHNTAEWGLWIGRPLIGQWTYDVKRCLDAIEKHEGKLPAEIIVIGEGPAGLVALCAAATDKRITKAAAVGALASYVTDVPYEGQRLGIIAPGILRHVGDVAHIAALAAPKRVVIAGGVNGAGKPLTAEQLRTAYAPAIKVWELEQASMALIVEEKLDPEKLIKSLK